MTSPATLASAAAPVQREPAESREDRRRARAAARAADRAVPPQRNASFSQLGLDHLRSYRQGLVSEEDTVSYWRRLLQARLDVVRAGDHLSPVDPARLRSILSGDRAAAGRTGVLALVAGDEIPELPDLARLWSTLPTDEAGRVRHEQELAAAETALSAYRAAVHRRLDEATAELIARYHEDPVACLVALPLPRVVR